MTQGTIKRLYRSRSNRIFFGFCGGVGEYFQVDPVIVRIIYVLLILGTMGGFVLFLFYLLSPLFVPLEKIEV